ncbi:hypothetical protein N657DRAFT_582838 [Parathielavia appendiculata]|uniref:Uncharacterized protein n=1 Tax=Parathielavia appendiculata TaxID=2587402 RepID=A0AAN6TRN7_9PEZI|nr:hypothetical protein N657DRAFT_582838 [Parathielavia appendiculata]
MYHKLSGMFDLKWKLRDHISVLVLVIVLLILTGVYMNLAPFVTRPDIMGIVYSIKSIIIILYQLLTEHTRRFARWKSLKANCILNCIEPVFWLTLIILKFMGISKFCSGSSCGVAWVSAIVVIVIFLVSVHLCMLAYREYREFRKFGTTAGPGNLIHAAPATCPTDGPQDNRDSSRRVRPNAVTVHRRSHAKSRTGCRTCKRRRIKSPRESSTPSQPQGSVPSTCDLNLIDLELMHNFTTYTCTTIASDPAVRQMLRTTAVHMAVECEYLMRAILAVSALHLSRYRPQKKTLYLERAMHHHQAASSVAIELMTDLRVEECERFHLFSMLTVYYALGCPINEADLGPGSPLIPHWLRLLHGMEPILHMLNPKEYRGTLTPLFDYGKSRMRPFLTATPPRDPTLLADLQSSIHRTCTNPDLIPTYDNMIQQLRRMLGLILTPSDGALSLTNGTPASPASALAAAAGGSAWTKIEAYDILIWQWTQGRNFLPLLEAASPPQEAVVIFAHCLLVLRKLENQWWAEGWADHLMNKTWAMLDEEHRHWVGWVTEEMGWIPPR